MRQVTDISLQTTRVKPSREEERFSGGSRFVITVCAVLALFACYKIWTRPNLTPTDIRLQTASVSPQPSGSRLVTKPIGEARCFDWVLAENPYGANPDEDVNAIDWREWRLIDLQLTQEDGSLSEITLARDLDWIEWEEAEVGGSVWLDLFEMGIVGDAEVVSTEPAPELTERPSERHSLITATFKHHVDGLIGVQTSGDSTPIGCTPNHPFWSEDRQEFVAAGELRINEHVETITGQSQYVIALYPRPGPTAVYNIEVYGIPAQSLS